MTVDRAGELTTWPLERLFQQHYGTVFRLCLRRLRDREAAEDATQEAFSRAAQHDAELRTEALGWILTVARNLCTDEIRRREQDRDAYLLLGPRAPQTVGGANPEDEIVSQMAVTEMMNRLTAAERRVVLQKCLLDKTHDEAGAYLGVSSGTTRQLLLRARRRLKVYLREQEVVPSVFVMVTGIAGRVVRRLERAAQRDGGWSGQLSQVFLVAAPTLALLLAFSTPRWQPEGDLVSEVGHRPTAHAPVSVGAGGPSDVYAPSVGSPGISPSWPSPSASINPLGRGPVPGLLDTPRANQRDFAVTDFAASPNYEFDHTLLAAGGDTGCALPPCFAIFASQDGGANWRPLAGAGFSSPSLVLPADFAAGHFYGVGAGGVQVTTDGGSTFQPLLPGVQGYGVAAPPWTSQDMIFAGGEMIGVPASGPPALFRTIPVGTQAAGPPVFDAETGSRAVLQPLSPTVASGQPASVTRCDIACGAPALLPFAGPAVLQISPWFAGDGIAAAWNGQGRAAITSARDAAYRGMTLPRTLSVKGLLVVGAAGRPRLVVLAGSATSPWAEAILASDDLGTSWQKSASTGSNPRLAILRSLGRSRLITNLASPSLGAMFAPICSDDQGSTWGRCMP